MYEFTNDPVSFGERFRTQRLYQELSEKLYKKQLELSEVTRRFEEFKDLATEVLHREGDARRFCSEFDDIMEEIGLPRRKRTYKVRVHATVDVKIEVEASSEDDAQSEVENDTNLVADEIYNLGRRDIEIDSINVQWAEEAN